jgi:phenylalanyl-tRNA synthetase beta chain
MGELHPRWQQKYDLPRAPILFEVDAEGLLEVGVPRYQEVSKFPPIVRDMALVVAEEVSSAALLGALDAARQPCVREIRLFDVYRGSGLAKGEKSLAFRIVMQDTAKTLTDSEADAAIAALRDASSKDFGAKLRS